ncbi:MAG: hypothetical protein ACTHN5_16550 [Phycisphaerae bacterium]
MATLDTPQFFMILFASVIMAVVTIRAIAQGSFVVAAVAIAERRKLEAQRHADNAEAEAAGRAAALEPLSLNPDGTIEDPIIGVVEKQ